MLWYLVMALFAVWLVAVVFFGKGGFIHIILLHAIAITVVKIVADRRAARE